MQQIDGQYSEFNPSEITNYGDGAIVRFPSGIRKIAQLPIPWLSDKNGRYHNEQVCKQFKQKHGLYFAPGKENVKQDRLKEPDKTKCEIYNVIKNGLNHAKDWQQLQYHLSKERIQIRFKYKGHTTKHRVFLL